MHAFFCRYGVLILLAAGFGTASASPRVYTIVDLGTLGGPNSSANGINNSGQIVGSADVDALTDHAFLYSGGVMTDLGTAGVGAFSSAAAINDAGQIAANGTVSNAMNARFHALAYYNGQFHDLGTLGGSESDALGIGPDGTVVGESEISGDAHEQGFANPLGGAMDIISTLGGNEGEATGMNASGVIVGDATNAGETLRSAMRVTLGGSPVDLGTLGGTSATAFAINRSGQIAGGANLAGDVAEHPFLYSGGVMKDLGVFGGTNDSQASAINSSGVVVGSASTASSGNHAFVYADGQLYDLNNLIPGGTGMTLRDANGINDAGQIVGVAYTADHTATHAFLLNPIPLPTVAISGKKKQSTKAVKFTIKGTASADTTSVTCLVGKKGAFKPAKGTTKWTFKAKLKPGKNIITVIAHGLGGDSTSAAVTVLKKG